MYFETLKGFYCFLLFCHDSYTVYFRLVMFIRSGGKARFLKEQMIMWYLVLHAEQSIHISGSAP